MRRREWLAAALAGGVTLLPAQSPQVRKAKLQGELLRLSAASQGVLGVTARQMESGDQVSMRGSERFPMASVYKLPIGLVALRQVEMGKLKLDQKVLVRREDVRAGHSPLGERLPEEGKRFPVSELLDRMISDSDNTASDLLLKLVGGPPAVTAQLRAWGINDIRVDRSELQLAADQKRMGARFVDDPRDAATPDAMAILLMRLQRGELLKPPENQRLLGSMTNSSTGAHRLRGLLPPGTVVADKTGTWSTINGVNLATNDVGVITLPGGRHIAVAVFLRSSRLDDKGRENIIAGVGKAVWECWQ